MVAIDTCPGGIKEELLRAKRLGTKPAGEKATAVESTPTTQSTRKAVCHAAMTRSSDSLNEKKVRCKQMCLFEFF